MVFRGRVSHAAILFIDGVDSKLKILSGCQQQKLYDNTAYAGLRSSSRVKIDSGGAQALLELLKKCRFTPRVRPQTRIALVLLREPYHANVGPFGSARAVLTAIQGTTLPPIYTVRVLKTY